MDNILETIAASNRQLVLEEKAIKPLEKLMDEAFAVSDKRSNLVLEAQLPFYDALSKPGMSFICECKKASPSKGLIAPDFPYLDIARDYERAGASAISVLTEPKWFMGDISYLNEIANEVSIPCLRKDFIVDEYMIYEAALSGAAAVLLICSILDSKTLCNYLRLCSELKLSALVEAHDREEVKMALGEGASIIGVNNRNLKDFSVDSTNCLRLREYVGDDALFVAESGIKTHADIETLSKEKVDAVLIGEAMMRSEDKLKFLNDLRGIE